MPAITINDGEVITAPGQYDMSMSWYHQQCCAGPSISSSGLRKIYHESPAEFWAFSDLNDFRFPTEEKDAFIYGRAAHALLLGDEDFNEGFIVLPRIAPPRPTSAQVNARNQGRVTEAAQERFDFWDDFEVRSAGRSILSESDLIHIEHIADNMRAHELMPLLLEGEMEQSIIWKDDQTGIWIKSRLDILSATGDLADLKTTHQTKLELLLRDIRKHGYDMQLGLATMALENVLGIPFDAETYAGRGAFNLFVFKNPPYHVMPVEVDFDALYWARIKCRSALNTMAECIKEDRWPGPVEGIPTYTAEFEAERLGELQAAGLLPNSA